MSDRPPWAVLAWADDASVYLELPCTDGTYHRLAFPLSESGLSRALNLLRSRPKPESHLPSIQPATQSKFTADQRALALRFLRGAEHAQ